MNIGWTCESGPSNVVEEQWEQLLCANGAAQWSVTAEQLTAGSRGASDLQTTLVLIQEDAPLGRTEAVCSTAGQPGLDGAEAQVLWELITSGSPVCWHRWICMVTILSSFPVKLWLNQAHSVLFTFAVAGGTWRQRPGCMRRQTRHRLHRKLGLDREAVLAFSLNVSTSA